MSEKGRSRKETERARRGTEAGRRRQKTRAADDSADSSAARVASRSEEEVKHQEPTSEQIEQWRSQAAERDEYLSLSQRLRAELVNYQKRMEKAREEDRKYQLEALLRELLPTLDHMQMALQAGQRLRPGKEQEHFRQGVEMTYRELLRVLQKQGLEEIAPQREAFDPAWHEAVRTTACEGVRPGTVVELVRKGYALHERTLRPAQVVIAQAPAPQVAPEPSRQDKGPAGEEEVQEGGEQGKGGRGGMAQDKGSE